MKKKALLGIFLMFWPCKAKAQVHEEALENFRSRYSSTVFSESRLSSKNHLILQATDVFLTAETSKQTDWVKEAFIQWRKSLQVAGISRGPDFIVVVSQEGGTLWHWKKERVHKLDEWADDRLTFENPGGRRDRLFGSLGGQMSTGGRADSTGVNARLGSTLFRNRYDLALTFSHNSVDTSPKFTTQSYGLIGRALFPWRRRVGWNIGGQMIRTVPSQGRAENTLSALGGINLYLPGGSFDVTLTVGNKGSYGFLIGYTVYLTRH